MRFMVMHKMTDEMEKGLPPEPEVMASIGQLMGDAAKAGVFVSGEGLKPSSQRSRIVYKNGTRTITDGPFAETKELLGGFALLKVRSKDELFAWCDKFAAVFGDFETLVGPLVEPWDLGFAPKPANAPLRFLTMQQMDARAESDAPFDPVVMEKLGALFGEMAAAGVLESTGGLTSTKNGARIRFSGGTHTVTDGPFTESKEVIAGFAIFDLPSKEAAIEWGVRFGNVVKVNEVEVRQMPE